MGWVPRPMAKRIATRGMDRRVCVWDAVTGKELAHAPAEWTNSPTIDFSPDGKFLFIGGPEWDEVTKLDAATGKAAAKYTTDPKGPKQAHVHSVRVSKDGKTVYGLSGPYSASDPGFVTTWDANTGERKRATELPARGFGGELSPGAEYVSIEDPGFGGVFAIGGSKKNLLEETKLRGVSLSGHFSDDGKWYTQVSMERAEGGWTQSAAVISTLNWGVACTIPLGKGRRAAISPDGATLAVVEGEKLEFYDTRTTRALGNFRVPTNGWEKALFGYVTVLRFTPDGTKLITGHADTTAAGVGRSAPAREMKPLTSSFEHNTRSFALRQFSLSLALLVAVPAFACAAPEVPAPPPDLVDYVTKKDDSFSWKLADTQKTDIGTVYDIDLVSQTWHDIKWDHKLQVFVPKGAKPQATMVLWNQGGTPDLLSSARSGSRSRSRVNAPVAFLFGVPKQPLFEGKKEDTLIAETFVQYLETKDSSWPLLFPMVKSVVRAMDALQQFAKKEWDFEVKSFVVTGRV